MTRADEPVEALDRHGIGANNPPRTVLEEIDSLYEEAQHWLDGAGIENDAQAEGLGVLMDMLAAARKACEAERKEKVAPFDLAKKEIQAVYTPAITKADRAIAAAKSVRDKWLRAKQAAIDEAARIAREKADAEKRAADEAIRASKGDLAAREAAEAQLDMAKAAERKALALAKAQPATIGGRKTVSVKYEAVIENAVLAAGYCWQQHRHEMEKFVLDLLNKDVRAGKRGIPGVILREVE